MEQLAQFKTLRHKTYSNSYNEKNTSITHQKVTDQQFIKRKRVVLSNNKKQIYGLRGLQLKIPASLFHGPKLPPGNPRLVVDVNEEPTYLLGVVLL